MALQFNSPDAPLRRQLVQGWHEEIRGHLNEEEVISSTDGHSFAEMEELKNLLIMHFMDTDLGTGPGP